MLTAAHCVNRRSNLKVVAGDHKPKDKDGDEQHIKVCKIKVHPKYQSVKNDIALLKLCTPVKASKYVGEIPMPQEGFELEDGVKLFVSGWGLTRESGRVSPTLRVVKVDHVPDETCKTSYQWIATKYKICAGIWKYGGKDSCQGDSGGPLWHINEEGKKEIVGIVSSGRGCARPYYPGLYTKVSAFRNWIDETVNRY